LTVDINSHSACVTYCKLLVYSGCKVYAWCTHYAVLWNNLRQNH